MLKRKSHCCSKPKMHDDISMSFSRSVSSHLDYLSTIVSRYLKLSGNKGRRPHQVKVKMTESLASDRNEEDGGISVAGCLTLAHRHC